MKVGILGAGIAGLTTSLYLRRHNYEVTIYERNDTLSEVGAGIQIPPNALRLLTRLGLAEKIAAVAFEPHGIETRRYDDGSVLQRIPGKPVTERVFGARHFLIHRPAYQQILYDANIAAGVTVVFGAEVKHIDLETPAVTLVDGRCVSFDLIVGADGVNSLTRQTLYGANKSATRIHAHRAYRALIPSTLMTTTPYGQQLMTNPVLTNWIGPHRHVVGYPISSSFYNLVLCHPGRTDTLDSWNQSGVVAEMHATYADFNPRLRSVLDLVTDVRAWKLQETPTESMESWSSRNGEVVLVGDAAHAMLPYAGQGAAQAVEDAAVLAACLGCFVPKGEVKRGVESYFGLRRARVERVMKAARVNGELWSLEDGVEQRERDERWKVMAERNRSGNGMPDDEGGRRRLDEVDVSRKEQQLFLAWVLGVDVEMEAMAFLKGLDNGRKSVL